ncbi:MAG TPA: DUF819 family protein [Saprospiraceae bacterium]|nr:DUF819 family protein [Saprospiraceae bacterium]
MESLLPILALLTSIVAISEWLVRHTWLKNAGTALLVIIIGATAANTGLLPGGTSTGSTVMIYDLVFTIIAPLSIFWLLLGVNIGDIKKAGWPIIGLFFLGSVGTAIGVLTGLWIFDIKTTIGPMYKALAGMLTGTYTGGSINFNALAIHFNVMEDGILFAGTVVADNVVTALWMIVTLVIPVLLSRPRIHSLVHNQMVSHHKTDSDTLKDEYTFDIFQFALLLGMGLVFLLASEKLNTILSAMGYPVPVILLLTIFALLIAQWQKISRLKTAQGMGLFSVYLFLTVIGAHCDLAAIADAGPLGISLFLYTLCIVTIHGIIIYGLSALFGWDIQMASIASQANIGGGPTALAVAKSFGRHDMTLPAILIGSLGNAIGTFLGFWMAGVI